MPTIPMVAALTALRTELLSPETLVRAVATGRRRGAGVPPSRWRRVEVRYVNLKAGRQLQVTAYDETQAHTSNHSDPIAVIDDLLAEPFANWHVETATATHQLRATKRGEAAVHVQAAENKPDRAHDRIKERLLATDDPTLAALGITDAHGSVKPTRAAKLRQVEDFLRTLAPGIDDALAAGHLRPPSAAEPLRIIDLGCGNAYLTFAAHAYLTRQRGWPVRLVGVDVKRQSLEHNQELARRLGVDGEVGFVQGGIADVVPDEHPDVVLALHACDTATDDALARAVEWEAGLILAAPCCHHDISAQLRRAPAPPGYDLLTRDGILRERLADTLTDGLRAAILRMVGYRVEVVEFVESKHTPRNTLLRAVRTGRTPAPTDIAAYADLTATWQLQPRLGQLLADRIPAGR